MKCKILNDASDDRIRDMEAFVNLYHLKLSVANCTCLVLGEDNFKQTLSVIVHSTFLLHWYNIHTVIEALRSLAVMVISIILQINSPPG